MIVDEVMKQKLEMITAGFISRTQSYEEPAEGFAKVLSDYGEWSLQSKEDNSLWIVDSALAEPVEVLLANLMTAEDYEKARPGDDDVKLGGDYDGMTDDCKFCFAVDIKKEDKANTDSSDADDFYIAESKEDVPAAKSLNKDEDFYFTEEEDDAAAVENMSSFIVEDIDDEPIAEEGQEALAEESEGGKAEEALTEPAPVPETDGLEGVLEVQDEDEPETLPVGIVNDVDAVDEPEEDAYMPSASVEEEPMSLQDVVNAVSSQPSTVEEEPPEELDLSSMLVSADSMEEETADVAEESPYAHIISAANETTVIVDDMLASVSGFETKKIIEGVQEELETSELPLPGESSFQPGKQEAEETSLDDDAIDELISPTE